jgi:tRNA A37 threonylcarbamoyladenosine modification protein TsaB
LRAEPPLILAFDTAAAHCAAALVLGDAVLARRDEPMARGQAERLLPMLEEMLAETRRGWADLDALAVCTGPGNFTGLRLAVAAARGLAMGLGVPAIGVSRFEALAEGTAGPMRVVLQDPVVQDFLDGEPLGPPRPGSDTPPDAAETRADPVRLARVAVLRLGKPAPPPAPLYIRPADATPAPEPVVLLLDDA